MLLFDGIAAQCDNFTSGETATSWYLLSLVLEGISVLLNAFIFFPPHTLTLVHL